MAKHCTLGNNMFQAEQKVQYNMYTLGGGGGGGGGGPCGGGLKGGLISQFLALS